jgi:hypothetical protein
VTHAYYHAVSSAKKWGGEPEDYIHIHEAMDESRRHVPDKRHRFLYHHSAGIEVMVKRFGPTVTNSRGRKVPTAHICEQHITEDCGFVPSLQDWLDCMAPPRWGSPKAKLLFDSFQPTLETEDDLQLQP